MSQSDDRFPRTFDFSFQLILLTDREVGDLGDSPGVFKFTMPTARDGPKK